MLFSSLITLTCIASVYKGFHENIVKSFSSLSLQLNINWLYVRILMWLKVECNGIA